MFNTILMVFILAFLHLPENNGASNTNSVVQKPPFIIKKSGESVSSEIQCSHSEPNYDRILWYKQDENGALHLLGYLNVMIPAPEDNVKEKISFNGDGRKHSNLSISTVSVNDNAVYFCAARHQSEAHFGAGTKLTVLETGLEVTKPKSVKILPPSPKECRNEKDKFRKKTLVCVASGFYPDHVEVLWTINGNEAKDGVATDSAAKRVDNFYRITSRLRVLADDYNKPSNNFTCIVKFFDGEKKTLHHTSINGVEGEAAGGLKREDFLKMTNTAKLSYIVLIAKSCFYGLFVVFLVWKLQGSARKFH